MEILIRNKVIEAIKTLYGQEVDENQVQVQTTRKEFSGDKTVVVFPFLRFSKKTAEQTADEIGTFLVAAIDVISEFNFVKGFLNLVIDKSYWINQFNSAAANPEFGIKAPDDNSEVVMIEYSSPNTNKLLQSMLDLPRM